MSSVKLQTMLYIAFGAVVLTICSWITIPTPLPFTMQTFGVCMVLLTLGGLKGEAAILLYLLLGMVGIPVFSGFTGGIGHILGPTGGYLVGFLIMGGIFMIAELIEALISKKISLKKSSNLSPTSLTGSLPESAEQVTSKNLSESAEELMNKNLSGTAEQLTHKDISGSKTKYGKRIFMISSLILGLLLCYLVGTLWYVFIMKSDTTLGAAIMLCVVPYIVPDIIKVVLAVIISERVRKTILMGR